MIRLLDCFRAWHPIKKCQDKCPQRLQVAVAAQRVEGRHAHRAKPRLRVVLPPVVLVALQGAGARAARQRGHRPVESGRGLLAAARHAVILWMLLVHGVSVLGGEGGLGLPEGLFRPFIVNKPVITRDSQNE